MHIQHPTQSFFPHHIFVPHFRLLLILTVLMTLSLMNWHGNAAGSIGAQATPVVTPTLDRLATPIVPANPTSIELGSMVYYVNCMPCHGDKGQGLTDEFRALYEDHANCWAHGCHDNGVDAEGYPLPRTIPAVTDTAHFKTKDELIDYLSRTHPPQKPGALSAIEYRNVADYVWSMSGRSTSATDQSTASIGLLIPIGLGLILIVVVWRKRRSIGSSIWLIAIVLVLSACGSSIPVTATPIATPDLKGTLVPDLVLTLTANRLDKPVVPAFNPSQADKGAITYWLVCLPCHGDKGQGLTDEWRLVFGVEEMNCWQSKCHATNHPEGGFVFPHIVPAVIGPNALMSYNTAADLHKAIEDRMPFYDPQYLSPEEHWNVTAYLLQENNVLPKGLILNDATAPIVRVHVTPPDPTEERPITIGALGFLIMSAIVIVYRGARRSRSPHA